MALDTTSFLLGKKAGGGAITESDPIFSASAASGITNADIEKWNSNFVYLGKISDHNTAAKAINLNGLKAGYYYVYTDTTNLYIGVTNSSNGNYVTQSLIFGTDESIYIWNKILYIYIANDIPSTGLATNTKIGKLIYIRDKLYAETYGQSGANFYKEFNMDFTVFANSIEIAHSQNSTHNYMTPELNEKISGKKTFTTLPESSVVPTNDNQLVNKKYVDDNAGGSSDLPVFYKRDNTFWSLTLDDLVPGTYLHFGSSSNPRIRLKGLDNTTEDIDTGGLFFVFNKYEDCANDEFFMEIYKNNFQIYTLYKTNNAKGYSYYTNPTPFATCIYDASIAYLDGMKYSITGYDSTKTQVLKNVNGTLTWVDE